MKVVKSVLLVAVCALLTGGCSLVSWGNNIFGQVGNGTTANNQLDPSAAAPSINFVKVEAGYYHSCGIDSARALYCWGNNTRGELGIGTSNDEKLVPTRVGTANDWSDVSAGGGSSGQSFTCGIRAGSLFCWGWNHEGELGLGDTTDRLVPTQIGTDTDWKSVSTGDGTSCALRTSGALYCWGAGIIGNGTVAANHLNPVHVGVATWKLVSSGSTHTCAIRTTGALYCWGRNYGGQLGDGDFGPFAERLSVTQVGTATDWTSVSAGGQHTCGIRSKTLYCWGNNWYGSLGIGTFSDPDSPNPGSPEPVQVGTATDWAFIAVGNFGSCGIRASHLLYCWGDGASGDGTDVVRNAPTQVAFDKWVAISVGGYHRLGLRYLG